MTANGSPINSVNNPFQAGYYSNYFNGSSNLALASNAAFQPGTGDFTIEAFVNFSANNSMIIAVYSSGVAFYVKSTGYLAVAQDAVAELLVASTAFPLNTWTHVALVRSGTTLTLYQNGISVGSTSNSTNFTGSTVTVGSGQSVTQPANGYISNFRLVKGTAVYTSNFTPSTTPLTAISGTSLLTCQSNRFIDNSSNNFTITVNGSPTVSQNQPFTYTAPVTYGSGYLSGASGNYLSVANNTNLIVGSGDFTIECWVNMSAVNSGNANPIISKCSSGSTTGWLLSSSSTGSWQFCDYFGNNLIRAGTVQIGVWTHLAVTRSGSTVTLWVNGSSVGTASYSTNFSDTAPLMIGYSADFAYTNGYISNARLVKGTAVYTTTFTPPTAPLTAVSGTSLLTLQNNVAFQNNTFVDSSANNFPITRNGNTTQGSFSPYGTLWSYNGNGSNTYALAPNSSAFDQTSAFTLEWFDFLQYNGAAQAPFYVNTFGYLTVYRQSNGVYQLDKSGVGNQFQTSVYPWSTWNHVALSYDGTYTRFYINGQLQYTYTGGGVACGTTPELGRGNGGINVNGYISNLRFTKAALYTGASFTVPTAPLPVLPTTSFLTFQSNRFIDTSTNNLTITTYNNPSIQRFSPFNPTSAYSTSVIGGAGYFDGSGDSLATPSNAAVSSTLLANDFTIECWFYVTTISWVNGAALWTNSVSNSDSFTSSYINPDGSIGTGKVGVNEFTSSANVWKTGCWNHFALVRSGSNLTMYLNGSQIATTNSASTYLNTSASKPMKIGASSQTTPAEIQGYISDTRCVFSAIYTGSTYTVPSAPLTAISGTSLLLNYTNAGIPDLAMQNNLQTVGSASVNTSVVKYGTGSLSFPTSGDYLKQSSTINLGNTWTIEYWYQTSTTPTYHNITLSNQANGGGSCWMGPAPSAFTVNNGGTTLNYSYSPTYNTWEYYAIVNNAGTLSVYVNGTRIGSPQTGINSFAIDSINGYNLNLWVGYMDDLRITNGVARYSGSTMTVPTAALPTY